MMKIRKISPEELDSSILCQHILKRHIDQNGHITGYDLCDHLAKWKVGNCYYCGKHKKHEIERRE